MLASLAQAVLAGANVVQIVHQDYVSNDDIEANRNQADTRAKEAKDDDPFPHIPAALLSSEHIQAYVRQTAMVHPFWPNSGVLKAASYEINPGGDFVVWTDGKKVVKQIEGNSEIVLPPNSISFVQLASKIRLPNYVAMRFNLRITHVHRGLLLGTGPLVDPGYHGCLLIPLHNLTAEPYTIRTNEGLIWAEFTKTSRERQGDRTENISSIDAAFFATEGYKTDRPIEYYFQKASGNRPIESSIPDAIRTARDEAGKAKRDARDAKRANQFFAGLGLLTVLGLIVSLYSFIQTAHNNQMTAGERALRAENNSTQALKDVGAISGRLKAVEDRAPQVQQGGPDAQALTRRVDDLEK